MSSNSRAPKGKKNTKSWVSPSANGRGTRNVNSHQGWILFLLSLLVASFLGGAVRLLFSSQQLQFWIGQVLEAENPPFDLAFTEVRVTLSDGAWPRLGVVFKGLHIKAKDACDTRAQLHIDELYLPVSLRALLGKKLKFRTIAAHDVQLTLQAPLCPGQNGGAATAKAQGISAPETATATTAPARAPLSEDQILFLQTFFRERWRHEMENSRQWLDGMRVQRLRVQRRGPQVDAPLMQLVDLRDFRIWVPSAQEPLEARTTLVADPALLAGLEMEPVDLRIRVDDSELRLNLRGHYQEGRLESEAVVNFQSAQLEGHGQLRHLPARPVFNLLRAKGLAGFNVQSRLAWTSCDLSAAVPLLEPAAAEIKASECRLEGDFGTVRLAQARYRPFVDRGWEPVVLTLERLAMDRLLEAFEVTTLKGVVHRVGYLSGEAKFSSPADMQFSGGLEDVAIIFSRQKNRVLQVFPKVALNVKLADGRVSGLVDAVEVDQGAFAGQMSFNFERSFRAGLVQVNVEKLDFSGDVQRHMTGGSLGPLEIYGQAQYAENQWQSVQGHIGAAAMQGPDWQGRRARIAVEAKGRDIRGSWKLAELDFKEAHPWSQALRPVFLTDGSWKGALVFRDLQGRYRVDGEGGTWERARASSPLGSALFASQGHWQPGGGLGGEIVVDFPSLKLLKWELSGTWSEPRLLPSAQMLKDLARKDPRMRVPAIEEPEARMSFFKNVLNSDRMIQLKKLGQSVLDSAKDILPGEASQ